MRSFVGGAATKERHARMHAEDNHHKQNMQTAAESATAMEEETVRTRSAELSDMSCSTAATTALFTYVPTGEISSSPQRLLDPEPPSDSSTANEVGTHLQTELEKYYQNNLLMRSTATASLLQPEDETPLLQEEKGEFGALRSPIAGDLASPQHGTTPHLLVASSSASSASSASKSSLHSKQHLVVCSSSASSPHTPTHSSSAATDLSRSPSSTPHSLFPTHQQSTTSLLDSSTIFLSQNLSELMASSSFHTPSISSTTTTTTTTEEEEEEEEDKGSHSREPIICLWNNCRQEFPSLAKLVSHLDHCHTLAMTQFICLWEKCSRKLKPFDARYKLITHLRCHTGEKPYQCEVPTCKRSFSRLENLKLHTRTHTGEKPYECHYEGCTKKFNNTSDRAKHMKTHITRKPYACKYPGCGKCYTDPSSMRKHIKYTHLKEDTEGGVLPALATPNKRKRNSGSSSSSCSSSSSTTPLTPRQMQQQQQQQQQHHAFLPCPAPSGGSATTLFQEAGTLLQAVPVSGLAQSVTSAAGGSVNQQQAQLIPVMKIATGGLQGSQQVLVPAAAYSSSQQQQQQPSIMMILTNSTPTNTDSSSSRTGHTKWNTGTSSQEQLLTNTPKETRNCSLPTETQATPFPTLSSFTSPTTLATPPSSCSTTNGASSVEEQLRQHIVHLQQQLYQSQLAAANLAAAQAQKQPQLMGAVSQMVPALPEGMQVAPTTGAATAVKANQRCMETSSPQQILVNGLGPLHAKTTQSMPQQLPAPKTPEQAPNSVLVSNSVPILGTGPTAAVLPHFIPVPILQSQSATGAQFLFNMTP